MARGTCTDCGRKHIGQAMIMMDEAKLGYPHHEDYSMAHLAEAESETRAEHPELAATIRAARMGYMHDGIEPNFDTLLLLARKTAGIHDHFDPRNSKEFVDMTAIGVELHRRGVPIPGLPEEATEMERFNG